MTGIGARPQVIARSRPSSLRPVIAFGVIAYALSWSWLIPWAASGRTVTAGQGWPTHFPSLVGPLVAAVVLVWFQSRSAGLRRLIYAMARWRMGWRTWLVALSPIPVVLMAVSVMAAFGKTPPAADFGKYSGLPSLGLPLVWLMALVINGFGEETGWRGYALPQLQARFSPVKATVILSLLWAGWHAPQFFYVQSFKDFPLAMIPIWVYGLFCGAVVMTWLYNHSGGSILVVAVFHTLFNLTGGTAAASDHSGALSIIMYFYVVLVAIYLLRAEHRANLVGQTVLGPLAAPDGADPHGAAHEAQGRHAAGRSSGVTAQRR